MADNVHSSSAVPPQAGQDAARVTEQVGGPLTGPVTEEITPELQHAGPAEIAPPPLDVREKLSEQQPADPAAAAEQFSSESVAQLPQEIVADDTLLSGGPSFSELPEHGSPAPESPEHESQSQIIRPQIPQIPQIFDARVIEPRAFDSPTLDPQEGRKRSLRVNLGLLLCCTLAGFVLATWLLVRMDSPFGVFSTGPREVVRAQLRALNRGEIRGAYDLLSDQYRQQVNFNVWREMILRHWAIFHAEVLRAGNPAQSGPRTTLEIHLRGADRKAYRARFTLIQADGRWWIDDVHWAEEPDEHDISRT